MKNKSINRILTANKMILAGLGIGVLYWILESAMHALVFHRGNLVERMLAPGLSVILVRLLVMGLLLVLAVYAQFVITKRKRAEELLELERRRLSMLLETFPGYIYLQSPDYSVRYANQYFVEHFGEPKGRPCYEVLWGRKEPCEVCPTFEVFDTKTPQVWEWSLTPDGRIYVIYDYPFIDSDGSELVLEIGVDITERKRAEEALRESEERFRTIFAQSPVGIEVYDASGKLIDANPACLEMFGVENVEAVRGFNLLADPNGPPEARSRLEQGETVKYETVFDFELVRQRALYRTSRSGQVFVDCLIVPLRASDHSIAGYLVHVRDITERKRMEEALRESEEHYRSLFERVPAGLYRTTPEGQILDVNPALVQMLEYPGRESLLAINVIDGYVNPQVRKQWQALVEREGVVRDFEVQWRRHDGTIIWVRENARVVRDGEGQVLYYEGAGEDITERKRAEEALKLRAEQLAALSQASQIVTASLELDQVLAKIVSLAGRVVASDYTSVVLVDEAGNTSQSAEDLPGVPSIEYRIRDEGLTSWIVRSRQSAIIDEIGEDGAITPDLGKGAPRFVNPPIVEAGVKSVAGLPLMVKDRLLGVLYLHSLHPGAFHGQLPLLATFANQAAIAIENARLYESEHATREQLRDLAGYLQAAREEERAQIAREIHDEFGQALSALNMDLSWLSKRLPADQPHLAEKASAMSDLIDSTIQTVRRVATELRPGLLDELGLAATMEWQAEEFTERTGIDCDLYLTDKEIILERDLATAIFRIFQETLTNVARHAEATEVHVELEDRPDELVLIVRDNGKGITESQLSDPKSLGLMGIRERAHSWGGEVAFQGIPGQGTTVTVRIPNVEFGIRNSESSR